MRNSIKIELFYTLTCPNCQVMKKMIDDVLTKFPGQFEFKPINATMPLGMSRSIKLGIHSVPTLLINNEIVFKGVPTRQELIEKLNKYIKN